MPRGADDVVRGLYNVHVGGEEDRGKNSMIIMRVNSGKKETWKLK